MIVLPRPEPVVTGLDLPECPRWHDGALWFSDITGGRAFRLGADGRAEIVFESADDYVGGLGFAADGALLAVLSKSRRIVRVSEGRASDHADLSGLCRFVLNDMAVKDGRAWVGQPGANIWTEEARGMPAPTELLCAEADGAVRVAASDLNGPNGIAVSPDGRTLYVAESTALRITAFTIGADGALSDRRAFAVPDGSGIPDGICLDDSGAVWAAIPVSYADGVVDSGPGVVRFAPDGTATHVVPMAPGRRALACAFGGDDRRTLFVCTVPAFEGAAANSAGQGQIEQVRLEFVGAGTP